MKMTDHLMIDNITKLYGSKYGIKSVSAVINSGEITAIIGPNGVGKTTLVKCIAGLLQVSEGTILLSGISTSDRSCKPQIGYMQNELDFYNKMTVYEILDFICKVKYAGKFCEEIEPYLKKYNLYEYRNSYMNELSVGMKRKLSIIMSLLGTPKLILLDEPTNGVDTYGILQLKADLAKCSQKGSIVIITSHVLDFLEKICSRCIFLKDGMIVQDIKLADNGVDLENLYEKLYTT